MITRIAYFLNFNLQCLKAARHPRARLRYVVAIKHRHIIMQREGWTNARRWFVRRIKLFYETSSLPSSVPKNTTRYDNIEN